MLITSVFKMSPSNACQNQHCSFKVKIYVNHCGLKVSMNKNYYGPLCLIYGLKIRVDSLKYTYKMSDVNKVLIFWNNIGMLFFNPRKAKIQIHVKNNDSTFGVLNYDTMLLWAQKWHGSREVISIKLSWYVKIQWATILAVNGCL